MLDWILLGFVLFGALGWWFLHSPAGREAILEDLEAYLLDD